MSQLSAQIRLTEGVETGPKPPPIPSPEPEEEPECFLQGLEGPHVLVGQVCYPPDSKHHFARHSKTVHLRDKLSCVSQGKKSGRCSGSSKNHARVLPGRGSQIVPRPQNRHLASRTLVHHQKTELKRTKGQIDCRLQRAKSVFSTQTFQVRPHSKHLPYGKKRDVRHKNRLKARLFSSGAASPAATLCQHGHWRSNLAISGRMFWS